LINNSALTQEAISTNDGTGTINALSKKQKTQKSEKTKEFKSILTDSQFDFPSNGFTFNFRDVKQ